MSFVTPYGLLALFPVIAVLLLWPPPGRRLKILRAIFYALTVLSLCGVMLKIPEKSGTILVIADRSSSMPAAARAGQAEIIRMLTPPETSGHQLGVVAFAEAAQVEKLPEAPAFPGFQNHLAGDRSDLAGALDKALALLPEHGAARLLLLSDGRWTGRDPAPAFARLAARGVAVDFRSVDGGTRPPDLAWDTVEAPAEVESREAFTVGLSVTAPRALAGEYRIFRDETLLSVGKLALAAGVNRFYFQDRLAAPGVAAYRAEITAPGFNDPVPENNQVRFLIRIAGRRGILHISENTTSSVAAQLRAAGFPVTHRTPEALRFTLAELSAYRGIILENVAADRIGAPGMAVIAELVRAGTLGLLMTGGEHAFGSGGYFKSPLEAILPVSLELRKEHRKLAVAVAVALDRSGSMAARVAGGQTKMDLANLATAEVLDMLSPLDEIAVYAVDSTPHEIVPLMSVEAARERRAAILAIQSMGGGIFVNAALKTALKAVTRAESRTRHVILFADAADSEEPGDYQALLEQCALANITVSVIGLGTPADCDAPLLADIAARGKGRCFFTEKASELPRLFAMDTIVMARSTFVDTPVTVELNALTGELKTGGFSGKFTVDGYNLTYLRPGATAGALTQDEYRAPLVAWRQAELGRSAVFTGELDGRFGRTLAAWRDAGNLLAALVDYIGKTADGELPENMFIRSDQRNGAQVISLRLDPERTRDGFVKPPYLRVARGDGRHAARLETVPLQWDSPDSLTATIPLSDTETMFAALVVDGRTLTTLPPVILPYSPEYRPEADVTASAAALAGLCRQTGGRERLELAAIWEELPRRYRDFPLTGILLLLAIATLLLEVLERRVGFIRRRPSAATVAAAAAAVPPPPVAVKLRREMGTVAPPEPQVRAAAETPVENDTVSALRRARRNTRR